MLDQPRETPALPRPFRPAAFPREKREAARALWQWHAALLDPDMPALDGDDLTAYFEAEREKVTAGETPALVPEMTWRAARRACDEHDLRRDELAAQVAGARVLAEPPVSFSTDAELNDFIRTWATPHALLLARLAGHRHTWQERLVHELARGFFLTARLVALPCDVQRDRFFLPTGEMEQAGVTREQLRRGAVDEALRRLLWKQTIRIRDALAQGVALSKELPRRYRTELKRSWLGALHLVRQVEERDYDVWSEPVRLSAFQKVQIQLQAFFGNAASG